MCDRGYYRGSETCGLCATSGWLYAVIIESGILVLVLVSVTCYRYKVYRMLRGGLSRILKSRIKQIFVFLQLLMTMSAVFALKEIFPSIYVDLLDVMAFSPWTFPSPRGRSASSTTFHPSTLSSL